MVMTDRGGNMLRKSVYTALEILWKSLEIPPLGNQFTRFLRQYAEEILWKSRKSFGNLWNSLEIFGNPAFSFWKSVYTIFEVYLPLGFFGSIEICHYISHILVFQFTCSLLRFHNNFFVNFWFVSSLSLLSLSIIFVLFSIDF